MSHVASLLLGNWWWIINYNVFKNSAARIVLNISRYTSIIPALKKLHWLHAEHCFCFKKPHLFITFLTVSFLSILLHIFLLTVVLTVPGEVKLLEISLLFQSFILLLISLSNTLVIVLLSMLPMFGWLFLMRFMYLYTKAYPP